MSTLEIKFGEINNSTSCLSLHLVTHRAVKSGLQPARLRPASLFKRKQNKNTPVFLITGSHQDGSLQDHTGSRGSGILTISWLVSMSLEHCRVWMLQSIFQR